MSMSAQEGPRRHPHDIAREMIDGSGPSSGQNPAEEITVALQRFMAEALVNVSKDSDHAQKYFAGLALDRIREALKL